MTPRVRAPQLADWALAHGRAALTTAEVAGLLDVPADQVRRRLHAPGARGEWAQPARGLWLPVPPEFRTWGAPPGIEVIEHLARHLGVATYVGWLSAAALHGAAHQSPQVFQVATSHAVEDRVVGRTRFEFHMRPVGERATIDWPTRSGSTRVSTLPATMLDIAADPAIAAGIDNAATVIIDLSESEGFRLDDLIDLSRSATPAAVRRLGWLLDRFGDVEGLEGLRAVAQAGPPTPARLDPSRDLVGALDGVWLVRVNRDVEPDL